MSIKNVKMDIGRVNMQHKNYIEPFLDNLKYTIVDTYNLRTNGHPEITDAEREKMAKEMVEKAYEEYKNGPSSEYKYNEWCAQFACYLTKQVKASDGVTSIFDIIGFESSSTGELMHGFLESPRSDINFFYNDSLDIYAGKNSELYKNLYKIKNKDCKYIPKPGDFIFFDWEEGVWDSKKNVQLASQDHTGIIVDYNSETGIVTMEGNIGDSIYSRKELKLDDPRVIGYGSWYDTKAMFMLPEKNDNK